MYSRKLVLAALAGGLLMTTTLSAQRNYPTPRPKTVGNSIITNGGFEDPMPADLPTPPNKPNDYPKELLPKSSSDVFYEDEEAKEGGISDLIADYEEQHNIEYTEAQLNEFKTFVEKYTDYLKKIEKAEKDWGEKEVGHKLRFNSEAVRMRKTKNS